MSYEIEVPSLPKGVRPIAYRYPLEGEHYVSDGNVLRAECAMYADYLIVELLPPRKVTTLTLTPVDTLEEAIRSRQECLKNSAISQYAWGASQDTPRNITLLSVRSEGVQWYRIDAQEKEIPY